MCADRLRRLAPHLKDNRALEAVAVFAFSLAVLLVFYWPVASKPNQTFFGTYGDGLKNYYTPLYHGKYGGSLLHFEGMNYPYGEHIMYADAQPMLIWPVQLVERVWPGASGVTLAVLNLAMLLSLPSSCLVVFWIFRRLCLPRWYAAVVATAVVLFSPQVWRMGGHYSLSYTLSIPVIWLLLIRFFEKPTWPRSLTIVSTVILFSGLHTYYLALCSALIGSIWAAFLLTRQPPHFRRNLLLHLLVQVLLPAAAVYGFVRATDSSLEDRAIPNEWSNYTSSLKAVFLPSHPPYLGSRFIEPLSQPEGIGYVSVLGWIGLILLVASVVVRLARKSPRRAVRLFGPRVLRVAVLAALVALLLALGVFLHIPFMQAVLPDQLRQFRTLGRFIWLFYYIFMVASAYLIYIWYRVLRAHRPRTALAAMILILGIFWWEVSNFNVFISRFIANRIEELEPGSRAPLVRLLEDVNTERYQAVLPIPFYHLGSERYFDYMGTERSLRNSLVASLRTGLPVIGGVLNRTSLVQTRKTLGLLKGGMDAEPFLKDLPDARPILVIVTGGPSADSERRLLSRAHMLSSGGEVSLYELHLSRPSP